MLPEVSASFGREPVELGFTLGVGEAPLFLQKAAPLEAMQGRVERPLLDAEDVAISVVADLAFGPASDGNCPLGRLRSRARRGNSR
jgi:hypothetical protein